MKNKYDVSIIVATYNPDLNKLMSTLLSIIIQKGIKFEIIVTDDGSQKDYFKEVIVFFERNNFKNYRLIKNEINIGTVNNFYNALIISKGKYIFGISPGDMVYDENSLFSIFDFAEKNKAKVCFGDAVYYSNFNNHLKIYEEVNNAPLQSAIYDNDIPFNTQKIGFLWGNYILGVSFFRNRELAIKYIGKIKDFCRYVEDNTSTAFILADNIRIHHFKKHIVWYEYGTGVSTSKSEKWRKLLEQDFNNCYEKLYNSYIKDNIISAFYHTSKMNKKLSKTIYMVLNHPMILFTILKIRLMPKSIGLQHPINKKILENYLKMGSEY